MTRSRCPTCWGKGKSHALFAGEGPCPTCFGTGWVNDPSPNQPGTVETSGGEKNPLFIRLGPGLAIAGFFIGIISGIVYYDSASSYLIVIIIWGFIGAFIGYALIPGAMIALGCGGIVGIVIIIALAMGKMEFQDISKIFADLKPKTDCEIRATKEEKMARLWNGSKKFAEMKKNGWKPEYCPEREEEKPWWAFWEKSAEEIDKEIRVKKLRASNPSFFVCKDGWKSGNGLEYLQEAIIRICLNVVPDDVIKKTEKSFLWSVKRGGVMFNILAKNKNLDFFKKQVKALTFEELIKPIEYAEDEETFLFTSLTYFASYSQEGFNFVKKFPLKDVPYDVWVSYRGPQGLDAIDNVMSFRKFWEHVFNHKQWVGQADKMEAVAEKARIAVFPIPEGLEDYLDEQLQLAKQP